MAFTLPATFPQIWTSGGAASSSTTTKRTHAALGGHPYMLDMKVEDRLRFRTIPILRQQTDQSQRPGDQSINPEGLWRIEQTSYHFGAGQLHYDRKDSDPFRFNESMGVDPWTPGQLCLLPSVDAKAVSAATNLKLVVAGGFLYAIAGTALVRTADITPNTPTFTTITGTPGTAPTDIATDGFNIITCHGAAGIWKTTRGAAAVGGAAHITGTVEGLGFVKNRFLAFNNNAIYDISALTVGAGGALPAAYFTHPNTDFQWVGFAEGDAAIYSAGFSGDKSLIYKTTVVADGSALGAPTIAGRLEDGEIVTAISSYLGRFVLIGTNKGLRLAVTKDTGDLTIGARIDTPSSVRCFEGQGEFVWFGWSAFDSTDTGLGRISLKNFTSVDLLVPAYASDLMVHGLNNNVVSVVTFQDLRVFAVDQSGIYAEDTPLETSGWITSGEISYGLTEPKTAIKIDAQHVGLLGTHEIEISSEGGLYDSIGVMLPGQFPRTMGEVQGKFFELRQTLRRDTVATTEGLCLNSWLLLSQPIPGSVGRNIFATIILAPEVTDLFNTSIVMNTWEELDYIDGLADSKEITTWQVGTQLRSVVLDDYELDVRDVMSGPEGFTGFNGSCLLKMKEV
jgi:hypothetical protein